MVAELGAFAFELIFDLVKDAIGEQVNISSLAFFERLKVESRVKVATAQIVEPFLPFLAQEGVSEEKQRRLIQACVDELKPISKESGPLFEGSLNGQKIFENLCSVENGFNVTGREIE